MFRVVWKSLLMACLHESSICCMLCSPMFHTDHWYLKHFQNRVDQSELSAPNWEICECAYCTAFTVHCLLLYIAWETMQHTIIFQSDFMLDFSTQMAHTYHSQWLMNKHSFSNIFWLLYVYICKLYLCYCIAIASYSYHKMIGLMCTYSVLIIYMHIYAFWQS